MALIELVCRAVGSVFQRNGQLERLSDSLVVVMFEREVASLAAVHRRSGFHIWKGLLLPENVLASAARRLSVLSRRANVDALSHGSGHQGDGCIPPLVCSHWRVSPQFSCSVSTSSANFSSSRSAPKESQSFFAGLKVNFLSPEASPR